MKIDKRNPAHWLLLIGFFVQAAAGAAWRSVGLGRERKVVLYGHKLNGNLFALYLYMKAHPEEGLRPVFLTMDRTYHDELRAAGIASCWACGLGCMRLLGRASALVSDHGLHAMQPWQRVYRQLGLRFFDVWHGIPFKGFDAEDFRLQHRYDEVWVASDLNRDLYVERFGFDSERVIATGYPRTDRLLDRAVSDADIRQQLGLAATGKLVLFAPTWAQDEKGRSIYPFGIEEDAFLDALSDSAARHDATILLRSHLNTRGTTVGTRSRIVHLSGDIHPDTETILLASDALICDWSSIAFDYLLLDRPTFFLDVNPPFRKGFSLGSEYRFGAVVADMPSLLDGIEEALASPAGYWHRYGAQHRLVRHQVYGERADSHATKRCLRRLREHLAHGID